MHACSAYRSSNWKMFWWNRGDLKILKNTQVIPGHQMNILSTFNLSCVSTEIANWLKSMQNSRKCFVNEFIWIKLQDSSPNVSKDVFHRSAYISRTPIFHKFSNVCLCAYLSVEKHHWLGLIFVKITLVHPLVQLVRSVMMIMMMLMMMMMMTCFCGIADWRKVLSLTSSWDHSKRFSPSQISDTSWAGFEHLQNLSSGFVKGSCAVVITTTPRRRHNVLYHVLYELLYKYLFIIHVLYELLYEKF